MQTTNRSGGNVYEDHDDGPTTTAAASCCELCGTRLERPPAEHTCPGAKAPHSCWSCRATFLRNSELVAHMRARHVSKPLACPTCRKRFALSRWLQKHVDAVHGDGGGSGGSGSGGGGGGKSMPYRCSDCAAEYTRYTDLVGHAKTVHTGETPYVCGVCGRSYAKWWTAVKHMCSHGGSAWLKCGLCRGEFDRCETLRAHLDKCYRDRVPNGPRRTY